MNTCFKCGRKVDEKHRELYGILKWENTSGSDIIDSGATAYEPLALIRIGICDRCRKQLGVKARTAALKRIGGGAALLLAAVGVTLWISDEFGLGVAIAGVLLLISGILDLVRALKPNDQSSLLVKAFNGTIDPEWVLYPKTDKPLSVENVIPNSRYVQHYSCSYTYYNEAQLKKPLRGTGKAGSTAAALDVLKTWASDPRIISE